MPMHLIKFHAALIIITLEDTKEESWVLTGSRWEFSQSFHDLITLSSQDPTTSANAINLKNTCTRKNCYTSRNTCILTAQYKRKQTRWSYDTRPCLNFTQQAVYVCRYQCVKHYHIHECEIMSNTRAQASIIYSLAIDVPCWQIWWRAFEERRSSTLLWIHSRHETHPLPWGQPTCTFDG